MRFSSAILLATAASVAADISVESKAGKRLLSKARKLNYDVSQNWGYGYGYYKDGNYNNRQYDENYNNGMYEENYNNGMYQQNYNNGQYNQNYNNGQYNQQNNGNQQQQEQAEQGEYNEEDYDYQQYYEDQQQANANRTTEGTNGTNPNWGMDVDTNYDLSWMPGYSIKFDGCSTEYFKDAEENTMRLLAKFKLCPSTSTCSKCKGVSARFNNINFALTRSQS